MLDAIIQSQLLYAIPVGVLDTNKQKNGMEKLQRNTLLRVVSSGCGGIEANFSLQRKTVKNAAEGKDAQNMTTTVEEIRFCDCMDENLDSRPFIVGPMQT